MNLIHGEWLLFKKHLEDPLGALVVIKLTMECFPQQFRVFLPFQKIIGLLNLEMDGWEIGPNDVDRRVLWKLYRGEHIEPREMRVHELFIPSQERGFALIQIFIVPVELFRIFQYDIAFTFTHFCRENLEPLLKDKFDLDGERLVLDLGLKVFLTLISIFTLSWCGINLLHDEKCHNLQCHPIE